MSQTKMKQHKDFPHIIEKLKWVMACLRDPEHGCPWDKEQTFKTIMQCTIEEAYEVADAIEREDMNDLKEELGDLLFQVIYYSQMAQENSDFDFNDVTQTIVDKMIYRHPHVFSDNDACTTNDVNTIWEQQKDKEKPDTDSILDQVTKGLPSLLRAKKLQKKAAKTGFEWPNNTEAFDKVTEEIQEFKEASEQNKEEEFGDLLFALVNYARMNDICAEEALRKANKKFCNRFLGIEKELKSQNKTMSDLELSEMITLWKQQK